MLLNLKVEFENMNVADTFIFHKMYFVREKNRWWLVYVTVTADPHLDMLYDPLLILHRDEGRALSVPLRDAHAGDVLQVLQPHPVIICIRPHVTQSLKWLIQKDK